MKQKNSKELIIQCQQGDLVAFRRLVEENQSYGYALAFRMTGNGEDSRDIVQESMIRVWKHIDQFDPEKKFTTWYYRIIVNLCYDYLKRSKRERKKILIAKQFTDHLDKTGNPEEEFDRKEWRDTIEKAAGRLPPKQRTIFVLRDLQDLSIKEVMAVTGLSEGAVKSNLYHARKTLTGELKKMKDNR